MMMIVEKEYQENALLFFQGPFTVNFISYLGNYIQSFLPHEPKYMQQIFRAFVEMTQNVSYYSSSKQKDKNGVESGNGWFSIQQLEQGIKMSTGNLIKTEDSKTLTAYCDEINSLDFEELRKLKREVRSKAMMKDVNAHVGLIQISIVSNNKLDYRIAEHDKLFSQFILSVLLQ